MKGRLNGLRVRLYDERNEIRDPLPSWLTLALPLKPKLKVLRAVVVADSVPVVDVLPRMERPPKHLFHDPALRRHTTSVALDDVIARVVESALTERSLHGIGRTRLSVTLDAVMVQFAVRDGPQPTATPVNHTAERPAFCAPRTATVAGRREAIAAAVTPSERR